MQFRIAQLTTKCVDLINDTASPPAYRRLRIRRLKVRLRLPQLRNALVRLIQIAANDFMTPGRPLFRVRGVRIDVMNLARRLLSIICWGWLSHRHPVPNVGPGW